MHANQETQELITTLLHDLEARRFQRATLGPMVERGRAEPRALLTLLEAVLHQHPSSGAHVDILLAFLPEPLWRELVATALALARKSPHNDAANCVLRQAGLQLPETLHPYLEEVFRIEAWSDVGLEAAFRGARLDAVRFLFDLIAEGKEAERRRACRALLETRRIEAFTFAERRSDAFAELLPEVGFEVAGGGFRQLYTPRALHLAFPASYLDRLAPEVTERALGISHPTWQPASQPALTERLAYTPGDIAGQGHMVGGAVSARCALCGGRLARLLLLDPVPEGLGVRGLTRLELVACFSCLGWERELLHYRHEGDRTSSWLPDGRDGRGSARASRLTSVDHAARGAAREMRDMERAEGELEACPVELVDLGPRFRHQDWCTRENLHRVGGHPVWITGAAYPACPGCGVTSVHLAQIDSELLTGEGLAWTWGDGGICYVAWCDRCRVSTVYWQCA